MLDRFKTGPAITVAGALLLILGGVVVITYGGPVGAIIALAGCLIVVRERARQRKSVPGE